MCSIIRRKNSHRYCEEHFTFSSSPFRTEVVKGNGFNSSSIPVFQSETCAGHMRGALVCLNSTITILGLVIVGLPTKYCDTAYTESILQGLLVGLWIVICFWTCPVAASRWYEIKCMLSKAHCLTFNPRFSGRFRPASVVASFGPSRFPSLATFPW